MTDLVREVVRNLEGYVPGEQPTRPGVIKLNTNENPYPPSPHVREAIVAACDCLALYPDPTARALRERMAELSGTSPDGVVVGNGSDEILALLMRAVVDPGDVVTYPVPTYSLYDSLVAMQGGVSRHIPYGSDFVLPEEIFSGAGRMRIVCNPNSPSGTVTDLGRLEHLARIRSDSLVVIDEAYVDFADPGASSVSLVNRFPNVVVLRTLSKSYALAGLRAGFAITTPALAGELHKVRDSYNVGRMAQAGALAALRDQETMLAHVERVRRTRARLTSALTGLGFAVLPSQANFVLARRPGESLARLAAALRERDILVRHFGSLPDGLRITVGSDPEIDALLAAMTELCRGAKALA